MNTCVASAQFEQFCDMLFFFINELKKMGFRTGKRMGYPIGYFPPFERCELILKNSQKEVTIDIAVYDNPLDKEFIPYVFINVKLDSKSVFVKNAYIERDLNSLNKCLGSILKQVRSCAI